MALFGINRSPYMTRSAELSTDQNEMFARRRYQIVPGPHTMTMAQVELDFLKTLPKVLNPDMSLTLIMDRSGSMRETFAEGHVANVVSAIYTHISADNPGTPLNLVFYDDQVNHAGKMQNMGSILQAVIQNAPANGGTYVSNAIKTSIDRYRGKRGMYIIVITDGEFADKDQVMNLVVNELMPQVTPENPYAFRLHFVGAGEGVDHSFLQRIEVAAAGQGAPLVTQHHHAHLSHSHNSILDEMDKSYVGVGVLARFGEEAAVDSANVAGRDLAVAHTFDGTTRRTWEGPVGDLGFLPRRTMLGCEYVGNAKQPMLPFALRYADKSGRDNRISAMIPLPKEAAANTTAAKPSFWNFHLPWGHHSPEEDAAKEAALRFKQETEQRAVQVRQDEQIRQASDLRELARGGLPLQAVQRLKEIGDADSSIFTSDFAPEEAALLRREGFRALGVVTGSAMYHVGQAYASAYSSCEVNVLSDAYNSATQLAVTRMIQELKLIGGHGVVGVRLNLVRHEWADATIEVQVIGTAVEGPGPPPSDPWTSDLSGQEWYALRRAGYEPASLVWGHCTYFVLTTDNDEWTMRGWSNTELTNWSQALGKARNLALAHVKQQASRHGATGVAGVRIERRLDEVRLTGGEGSVYEYEHHNLVVSIIGTSIRSIKHSPTTMQGATMVLSLLDGRIAPVGMGALDAVVE